MKAPSPLLGFNNNVRHKGRVFHIQTEDSGVRHPHIITHLFADGGRIVKTAKTSYAEYLDAKNMAELVKQMMQDQHKTMLMALRDGQFDHLVDELLSRGGAPAARPSSPNASGPVASSPAASSVPAVSPPAQDSVRSSPVPSAELGPVSPVHVPPLPSAPAQPPTSSARPAAAPQSPPSQARPALPIQPPPPSQARPVHIAGPPPLPTTARAAEPKPAPRQEKPAPAGAAAPGVRVPPPPAATPMMESVPPNSAPGGGPRSSGGAPRSSTGGSLPGVVYPAPHRPSAARPRLDIDPGAIHRASAAPATTGATISSIEGGPSIDMDTLERAAAAEPEAPFFPQIRDLPPPPAAVLGTRNAAGSSGGYSSVGTPSPAQPPPPSTRGRYAASRPSSIFGAVRPQEGASIFGEDLISEKSLDEVILSYLAEDLDGPGEKK